MFTCFHRKAIFILLICHAVFFGCAKPPTEDMIKAEKAIEDARQKEADVYAKELFRSAKESYAQAKELVSVRNYEEARQVAIDTVQIAEQAGTVAEVNREKKRQRIEALTQAREKLRNEIQEALEGFRLLQKKDFRKKAVRKFRELQEKIPVWETALMNIKDVSDEEGLLQSTDELRKLSEEIMNEKQNIQSSLIQKKAVQG